LISNKKQCLLIMKNQRVERKWKAKTQMWRKTHIWCCGFCDWVLTFLYHFKWFAICKHMQISNFWVLLQLPRNYKKRSPPPPNSSWVFNDNIVSLNYNNFHTHLLKAQNQKTYNECCNEHLPLGSFLCFQVVVHKKWAHLSKHVKWTSK
jgi:hypothetical protein